jgi:ABC-type lipoprotein export system ATPase subunit
MDLLHEINDDGTTIIMVTHDPELVSRAQRNIRIFDGEVSFLQPLNTDVLVDREVGQSAHV